MSSLQDGPSLIHVGLAKTASTALDKHFFPHLGLPYCAVGEKFGAWYKAIRYAQDFVPLPYEGRQIISGVNLITPGSIPSSEVARRLHQTFDHAVLLVVIREAYDHFVSYYRELISIELVKVAIKVEEAKADNRASKPVPLYPDINKHFDWTIAENRSFFGMMQLDRILDDFRPYFRPLVIDYSLIRKNFGLFSDIICAELGVPTTIRSLPRENRADINVLDMRLSQIPDELVSPEVRVHLQNIYTEAALTDDRRQRFDEFIRANCARTYADAIYG